MKPNAVSVYPIAEQLYYALSSAAAFLDELLDQGDETKPHSFDQLNRYLADVEKRWQMYRQLMTTEGES